MDKPSQSPIILGRLGAAFGVVGWLHLHHFGDDPQSWATIKNWWLAEESSTEAKWQLQSIAEMQNHGKGVIVRLEGCHDRNAAEKWSGWYVALERNALPKILNNEYYFSDLLGFEVRNLSGELLGVVKELQQTPAHAVLVVTTEDNRLQLLPFVGAIVQEVQMHNRCIHVDWQKDW